MAISVQVPGHFPEKWDLADPLPEGTTQEDLVVLLDNASSHHGQRTKNGEAGPGYVSFRPLPDGCWWALVGPRS